MPGGGTTDYAVEVFHALMQNKEYTCFLSEDRTLPMMYMDDAISATMHIMDQSVEKIKIRTSYNLASISFSPKQLVEEIQKHFTDFKIIYQPDERDILSAGWPHSINDTCARNDWGWQSKFNLSKMVADIVLNLKNRYKIESV